MKMPIDKEWYEKRAAAEGDLEIGAGSHRLTMTLNLTDEELAKLEDLALDGLPAWARDKIKVMQAALLAIRDADDIHPSSSTHDVEQSRHRFRDIARYALAGYPPPPSTNLRVNVDRVASSIVTAACELDGPADPTEDDTISITMKDLEAVVHRHVTAALEAAR